MLESKDVGRYFPGVGVAVLLLKPDTQEVLLGKRKGGVGAGMWCPPGGRIEHNECELECARRETLEEAGITVSTLLAAPYTRDFNRPDGMDFLTLFFVSSTFHGVVELREPDKFEEWNWFRWNQFPEPLFYPMRNLLSKRYNPFVGHNSRLPQTSSGR